MAAGKRTFDGLIARGFPSSLANALVEEDYTIARLQHLAEAEFASLSIPEHLWGVVRGEGRPPIPIDTVIRLIAKSNGCCAVCKKHRAYVIHHLIEWGKGGTHEEDNLVVLCLYHHDEAHSSHELSRNLTPAVLRGLKDEWQTEVAARNAEAALCSTYPMIQDAQWDYFNHSRLVQALDQAGVRPKADHRSRNLIETGLVSPEGYLAATPDQQSEILYRGLPQHHAGPLTLFYGGLVKQLLQGTHWVDLSENWRRTSIRALCQPGSIGLCKGAFYFRRKNPKNRGPGQMRRGRHQRSGIRIQFTIDAWESASLSAWDNILSGTQVVTAIIRIRSLEEHDGVLSIESTCIAIGTSFGPKHETSDTYYRFIACDEAEQEEPEGEEF